MDTYKVDYMDADGEIITLNIEASGVIKTPDKTLTFLDKYGEDEAVFYLEDIIGYRKVEK
jgi:hypothetical protein